MSFYFGGLLPPGSAYDDFLKLMTKHEMKFCLVREMDELVPFMKNLEESKKSDSAEEVKNEDNTKHEMKFCLVREMDELVPFMKNLEESEKSDSAEEVKNDDNQADPAENSEKSVEVENTASKSIIDSQSKAEKHPRNQSSPIPTKKFVTGPIRMIIRPRYQKSLDAVGMTLPGSSHLDDIFKKEDSEEMPKLLSVPKIAARWASPFVRLDDQGLELETEDDNFIDEDDESDVASMDHYDDQPDIDELIEHEMIVEEFEEEVIPEVSTSEKKDHRYISDFGGYKCTACGVIQFKVENIKKHYDFCHLQSIFIERPPKKKPLYLRESTPRVQFLKRSFKREEPAEGVKKSCYACEMCPKKFSTFNQLHRHWSVHFDEQ